jgi:hypothetical protein
MLIACPHLKAESPVEVTRFLQMAYGDDDVVDATHVYSSVL